VNGGAASAQVGVEEKERTPGDRLYKGRGDLRYIFHG